MSNYFDDVEFTGNEKVKLKDFATMINAQVRGVEINIIPKLITDFLITGSIYNPITKKAMDIPYLPEKTGHTESDKENIVYFLSSFFDKFNVDNKAKDYLKTALETDRVKIVSDALQHRMYPSDEAFALNMEIDNNNSSTYTKYMAYTNALIVSESRVKPKWYQFSKRINQWREKRAVQKMEKKLKSLGVKEVDIDNAKKKLPTSKDRFKVETNFHDLLKEAKEHLFEADKYLDDDLKLRISTKRAQVYMKTAMKAYIILDENQYKPYDKNNEFEKKDYEKFHKLLKNFDKKVSDGIYFDKMTLDDIKENAKMNNKGSHIGKNNGIKISVGENEFGEKIKEGEFVLENIDEKQLEEELEHTINK